MGPRVDAKGATVSIATGRLDGKEFGTLVAGFLDGIEVDDGNGRLVGPASLGIGVPGAIVGTRIGAAVVGLMVSSIVGVPVGIVIGGLDGCFVGISGFLVGSGVGGGVMLVS